MIIVYWCGACHELHGAGEVSFPAQAGEPFRCLATGKVVLLRGIADDPDDENHGLSHCPVCQRPRAGDTGACPDCGSH